MRRAFDLDVLRCPRCAGRMELIATIDAPAVIQRILAHLGLPGAREDPREDPRPPLPRPRQEPSSPHSLASTSRRCRGPRQPRTSALQLPGAKVENSRPYGEAPI